MKITLYIRRKECIEMHTRAEEEPCYDTPRTIMLGMEIRDRLDEIIRTCEAEGHVRFGGKDKNLKAKIKEGGK